MKKHLKKLFFIVCVIAIWWGASLIVNKSLFLPSPSETFAMIVNLFETGVFFKHLGASFLRVTIGILIAASISIPLGMLIAWYKPVN